MFGGMGKNFGGLQVCFFYRLESRKQKTAPDLYVLCYSTLTFTVENKMGNSHKRGWSHLRLNINDGDIPFPKDLSIYQ